MLSVELRDVKKNVRHKGGSFVLDIDSFKVPDGKTCVVVGPSGSGKSTLLKVVAGLMQPDSGTVFFNGRVMNDVLPGQRNIGMVFQDLALYPHQTSKWNILSYFMFRKRGPASEIVADDKLRQVSELLEIDRAQLLDRVPGKLSRGEQQWVAVGRCLARPAGLFLFDEPFSHLDILLRQKYRVYLKKILREFAITTVYVTHDQQEAALLGDMVAVMHAGRIAQTGTYEHLYDNPADTRVAGFLTIDPDLPAVNLVAGELVAERFRGMLIGFRPEDATITPVPRTGALRGQLKFVTPHPAKKRAIVELAIGEHTVYMPIALGQVLPPETVWVTLKKFLLFDARTGKRLAETY
jgi:ABC-type sugar transport system ATPase subunit